MRKKRRWETENASHATRKKKTPTLLQQQAHFTRQADHPVHTRYAHRHRPPRRHARRLEAANRILRMLGRMPAAGQTQHWFYASRPWPPSSHSWAGTEESDTKTAGADTPNAAAETANRREVGSPPPGGGERAGMGGGGIRRVRHWRRVGVAMGPSTVTLKNHQNQVL